MIETPRPKPPAQLLIKPSKPDPPVSGSREDILNHAVLFGGYAQELELQLDAWIDLFGDEDGKD